MSVILGIIKGQDKMVEEQEFRALGYLLYFLSQLLLFKKNKINVYLNNVFQIKLQFFENRYKNLGTKYLLRWIKEYAIFHFCKYYL